TCRACRKYYPPAAIPNERSPAAGKDHLGNDRYQVDTGRRSPYFARHNYCPICLPVCVYNHKEWARDFEGFETGLFPQVVMPDSTTPVDLPAHERHAYEALARERRNLCNQEKETMAHHTPDGTKPRRAKMGWTWLLATIVATSMFVWVAVPVFLIMPF